MLATDKKKTLCRFKHNINKKKLIFILPYNETKKKVEAKKKEK